jgi:hypothetical protein
MEPFKYVIAFSGCARVGKTTAAELTEQYFRDNFPNYNVKRMSFGGPLKDGLAMMGVTKTEYPSLYRTLAQTVGTNHLRVQDNNWWTNLLAKKIDDDFKENMMPSVYVIDDVRFPNEIELVKSYLHGYNVFVYGGKHRIDLTLDVYKHESEHMGVFFEKSIRGEETGEYPYGAELDGVVRNTGSLKSFEMVIGDLLKGMKLNGQE